MTKIRNFKIVLRSIMVVFLISFATKVMAQSVDYDEYISDRIMGRVIVIGDSIEDMIWSGLRSYGFTVAQAAGIMGNIIGESGANPVRHEMGREYPIERIRSTGTVWSGASRAFWDAQHPMKTTQRTADGKFDLFGNSDVSYGVGLVQWSFRRRVSFMNHVRDNAPHLVRYFLHPDIYSVSRGNEFINIADNIEDVRRLVELNLEYLIYELARRVPRGRTDSDVPRDSIGNPAPSEFPIGETELEVMRQIDSVELAAEFFLFSFERPAATIIGTGGTYFSYWNSANLRAVYGRVYYEDERLRNMVFDVEDVMIDEKSDEDTVRRRRILWWRR